MKGLLSENVKIDTAIVPTAAMNGAVIGPYYSMAGWRKALFITTFGLRAAAATSILQAMQATDVAGTDAKVITDLAATATANAGVESVTLTLNAVQVADAIIINGLTFTAAAAADLPNRVFSQAGDDTADAVSLAAAINHATAGVPGVTATPAVAVVTLTVTNPGETAITIGTVAATITPATIRGAAYIEVDASMLDTADGFNCVALRVTNSAATPTSAVLIRGKGRYSPVQHVAAADFEV